MTTVTRDECEKSHERLLSTAQAWGMWVLGVIVTLITGAVLWIISVSSTASALGQRVDSHEQSQLVTQQQHDALRLEDKAELTARLDRIQTSIDNLTKLARNK